MSADTDLPSWADELRQRYVSGEASLFLLHGNVRDAHPWIDAQGKTQYLTIRKFLEGFLGRTRDVTVYYNVSQGLCFPDAANRAAFQRTLDAQRLLERREALTVLPTQPSGAIPLLEELITNPAQASGVILDFFEMIAAAGDVSFMGADERAALVSMQRWATDPAFLGTDNIVILIAEHLSEVARQVVASPQLVTIHVPFPSEAERARLVQEQDLARVHMELTPAAFAQTTAGLTLIQLRSLFRASEQGGEAITFRSVAARKKALIERECHGLVEFVAPDHNFSHVGGMEGVKADLLRVAQAVREGRRSAVPMGMIFVGPMGTGKTFVAEAFAGESGLTCLKFKNFREKWVGSTEGNLEKILDLVEALGFVLLILDEADRSLSAGGENDGGTSSRVIARLKEFMSDTSHRGRVVILMMTNRPDKLDTDLKRPGRFDLKIPFFFPEAPEERERILAAVARRNRFTFDDGVVWDTVVEETEGHSAAELEAVVLAASNLASERGASAIGQDDMNQAARDFIPSRDTRMLEFMEMLAVFECSAKRMLPDRFRDLTTDDVHLRLDALRVHLGRRAL